MGEYRRPFHRVAMADFCSLAYSWLSQTARGLGLYIDLKNSGDILEDYPQIVDMFDFSVIESCVSGRCIAMDGFTGTLTRSHLMGSTFGKSATSTSPF